MREAEAERDLVALLRHAVAHPDQLQLLGVALVDACDHVRDQAADETVQGSMLIVVRRPLADDLAVGHPHGDLRRQGAFELALRPLDRDVAWLKGDLDGARHRDRQLTYARQLTPLDLPNKTKHLAAESLAERLATAHDTL